MREDEGLRDAGGPSLLTHIAVMGTSSQKYLSALERLIDPRPSPPSPPPRGRFLVVVHPLTSLGLSGAGMSINRMDESHHQAMCFSLAACAGVPVTINDPECTAKTFPTYFDVLGELTTDA